MPLHNRALGLDLINCRNLTFYFGEEICLTSVDVLPSSNVWRKVEHME